MSPKASNYSGTDPSSSLLERLAPSSSHRVISSASPVLRNREGVGSVHQHFGLAPWLVTQCSSDLDHRAVFSAHGETEDVRPGVVAGHVEVPLGTSHLPRVQLGIEDAYLGVQRSGQELAIEQPTTYTRPSLAMCLRVESQGSPLSQVGARYICTPQA